MKTYYFDTFTSEIVTKKDPFAAPERYFIISPSTCNIYTDTYQLDNYRSIDFSYTKEESWMYDYTSWYTKLETHLEKHGVGEFITKLMLTKRSYPPEEFEKILKEYYQEA